ncbi:MAG: hypothetical protein PARBA_02340 [Parabacteroides sp.]
MATNYKWFFDLEEYTMTKDVKEDYIAKVKTLKSFTIEGVANAIAAERTEYRPETIVNISNLVDEKIRQLVCQGNTVVTGSALYSPSITGLLIGTTGAINPEINKCIVNVAPSAAMRAEVAKVTPEFSGNVKNLGGARISLVKDVTTGLTDGTITPGGMLDVTGSKIKCVNADGTGTGTLKLIKESTQAVAATITTFGINDPSRLMFTLPASLENGSYSLVLETWYSNSAILLKESRTLVYPFTLMVGDGEKPEEL